MALYSWREACCCILLIPLQLRQLSFCFCFFKSVWCSIQSTWLLCLLSQPNCSPLSTVCGEIMVGWEVSRGVLASRLSSELPSAYVSLFIYFFLFMAVARYLSFPLWCPSASGILPLLWSSWYISEKWSYEDN